MWRTCFILTDRTHSAPSKTVLHTCMSRPRWNILRHLYLTDSFLYLFLCIRSLLGTKPIPLHCEPRPVSRASLARRTGHTHDLCVRNTVTRLVIYPVTLCIMFTSGKFHAVTFAVGARGASLYPITTIKGLGLLLIWTFDHKLIPKSPLIVRLGLGIQQT